MKALDNIAARMDYIQGLFLRMQELPLEGFDLVRIFKRLNEEKPIYRSIAYESVSMNLAYLELRESGTLKHWFDFYEKAKKAHNFHSEIGLGMALAKADIDPSLFQEQISSAAYWMVLDGVGYYYALYKAGKTIRDQQYPNYISSFMQRAFDSGLGRRLWYSTKGNPEQLLHSVNLFEDARKPDIWRGIGEALAYVECESMDLLQSLAKDSGRYLLQLQCGVALSILSRGLSGSLGEASILVCEAVVDKTIDDIFKRTAEWKQAFDQKTKEDYRIWIGYLEELLLT